MTQKRKTRLLIVTDSLLHLAGGSERHVCHLVSRLRPAEYDIHIIQLGSDRHPGDPPIDAENVRLSQIPVGRLYGLNGLRAMRRVWRHIQDAEVDVVQSYHEKSDLISALLPKDEKMPIRISSRRDMGFKRSLAVKLAGAVLDRRFDAFVAPSQAIIDQLGRRRELSDVPRIRIANGVDLSQFDLERGAGSSEAMPTAVPADALKLTCLANLKPIKGHAVLLDALARTGPASKVHLLLAGSGPLGGALRNQATKLGIQERVHFLGLVDDVRGLLAESDGVVLASHSEGMSNALLEGLASGLPLIATSVGGNPEVIQPGVNGWLVPPGDAEQLGAAIGEFEADPERRATFGSASRDIAERQYSVEAMADRFDGLYKQMLRVRPAA